MINPQPEKLGELLNSPCHFVVPKYQRGYKWAKSEAQEFIEDLKSHLDGSQEGLFLGTMILDVSDAKNKKIQIVDGQQRITTSLLLLIACRELAKKVNAPGIATKIQDKITFVDPTTAESLGSRLVASESIKDVFEKMSDVNWDGVFLPKINSKSVKRQTNRIKPIYDFFVKEIGSFDQKRLSQFLAVVYGSYVVKIEIQNEMEAFSIFERTNARGVDLEASDLLKNYLFSNKVQNLEEVWADIVENSEGTMMRMLKYYYVSRRGYVLKSELFKKIKMYSAEITPHKLVEELSEFSVFYSVFIGGSRAELQKYFEDVGCLNIARDKDKFDRIASAMEGLRLFKIAQIYPVINAAIRCLVRCGGGDNAAQSKLLIKFFGAMESYHFINNAVCERIGNEVEKLYAEYAEKIANSDDYPSVISQFIRELQDQVAKLDEFKSRFTEITYGDTDLALISYVFDRINNCDLAPASRVTIFDPNPRLQRRNHNIEHIFPRNPAKDAPNVAELNNIGNLLAISFRTNSKLGNKTPAEKIQLLQGPLAAEVQNSTHVRKFIDKYGEAIENWGDVSIRERADEMAADAYTRVWKIN